MIELHLLDLLLHCSAFGRLQLAGVHDGSGLEMDYNLVEIQGLVISSACHKSESDSLNGLGRYVVDGMMANGGFTPCLEFI